METIVRKLLQSSGSSNAYVVILWGTTFRICSDHNVLESLAKVAEHNPRIQRWPKFPTTYRYTLEYGKNHCQR